MQENLNYFVGGVIAGEGYFGFGNYGQKKQLRFRFVVVVADDDRELIEIVYRTLGVGSILEYPPRKPTEKGSIRLAVQSLDDNYNVVMPFFEKYLIGTRKRKQFDIWKAKLIEAKTTRLQLVAKRSDWKCPIKNCGKPYRSRELCNMHYERNRKMGIYKEMGV